MFSNGQEIRGCYFCDNSRRPVTHGPYLSLLIL